jgi:branched-chain amino acid transport system permease protein
MPLPWRGPAAAAAVFALLAAAPLVVSGYRLSFMVSLLSFTVLATAWSLFSGTTRYISLATAAFFGLGAYLVAVLGEVLPFPLLMLAVGGVSLAVAVLVGLSTLRLSGMYFTIFTFGLAELIRQVTIWSEGRFAHTIGRYIFLDPSPAQIYWRLLALAVLLFACGWLLLRSRHGLALRAIGADETVARHAGIDTTRTKIAVFALSAMFMALTGAIMAPRWTYIDPSIAFDPLISFQVLIMALLGGGGRLWAPAAGVVPMLLVSEFLSTRFPDHFIIVLGLCFMAIVYFIPSGLAGLLGRLRKA